MQAYALDYVERYLGNIPQLERERECLLAALVQAWHHEQYAHVVQLTTGLAYLVGRLRNYDVGEHILLWGIQASRHTQDQQHLAHFLNRLWSLLCARGKFYQAEQVWQESVEAANALGYPVFLWEPFSTVAHLADVLCRYTTAQQFAEQFLHAPKIDNPHSVIVAIFIRGFYGRLLGKMDGAYNDFHTCLQLLSSHPPATSSSAYERFFTLEVQTELARVQGDYIRSQEYAEATLSLAENCCDPYTISALLCDKAFFAYQQGRFSDAYTTIMHLLDVSRQVEAPHHYRAGKNLLQHLVKILPEQHSTDCSASIVDTQPSTSTRDIISAQGKQSLHNVSQGYCEPLSKRELDVLQLVAEGLSNCEIATRLVITLGTVKKHIEHISNKLDAHSRTHAVARARALRLLP